MHYQRTPGGLPYHEVTPAVADVVESFLAELGHQPLALLLPGEVDPAVAREHGLEQAELLGDLLGEPLVGRGRQHQASSAGALCLQILQHRTSVREPRDIEGHAPRHLSLEMGLSPKQPGR